MIASLTFSAEVKRQDSIAEGERLFLKEFAVGPTTPGGGDGLGPLFNHVSCVACHRLGAIGGAGGIEFNVDLLSAQADPGARLPSDRKTMFAALRKLHPAFVTDDDRITPNILLHRFGTVGPYFEMKYNLGGPHVPLDIGRRERNALQEQLARQPLSMARKNGGIRLIRSQRNTTALFGAGLIDQIPDNVLHDLAKSQAADGKVSGRVPPIGPDKVGRFGWRGQQERLHDFVLGACANELGLEVPGNPQPINPFRPKYRPVALDLTEKQCESLTSFVASLSRPTEFRPRLPYRNAGRLRGHDIFESIGCAACHVDRLGPVDGIFSDLLLHDMGKELADPVLAEATLTFIERRPPFPPGKEPASPPYSLPPTYYGGSSFQDLALTGRRPEIVERIDPKTRHRDVYKVEPSNLESEWRTPPLWGVADSAPYLHDGRAESLVDAIVLHGGEAEFTVAKFKSLELSDRMHLVTFLRSLQAP